MSPRLTVLASALPGSRGATATAAALGVALAAEADVAEVAGGDGATVLIELGGERRRGPTMIASEAARELEATLREAGFEAAARGRLTWVTLELEGDWNGRLAECLDRSSAAAFAVILAPARVWRELLADDRVDADAALLRADLPGQRSLAALAARELRAAGLRTKVATRAPGRVAARRALAGVDPGGDAGRRARRLVRALSGRRRTAAVGAPSLAGDSGQSLPLVIGACLILIVAALILAAFGGAVSGKARAQRVADLGALSAARSMRDDFDRLFAPARLPSGAPNPAHLDRPEYLARARAAALVAARQNDADPRRVEVSFPDADSFAPLQARVEVAAELDSGAAERKVPVEVHATAEATPPSAGGPEAAPTMATGGGYSGPLVYRQGKPMRPDVGLAFDRMAAAARAAGISLIINSAYRSDAEQAALFAAHPDPMWVAPPGQSLHRCATELDLGPPTAYAWLEANAPRFEFTRRYSWEPWHFGYDGGPTPCSTAGDDIGVDGGSAEPEPGSGAGTDLPSFVPDRFREPILAAARRWNVSAALLAAQLMAESNFNPFAVSPAGAAGIAQFMPGTAASYGLTDPFDADAAINAQAHLMSDLLRQFGDTALALAAYNAGPAPVEACHCVPAISETQAYVARILGLMGGAGEVAPPTLEVRLVD
ncbi:MAG: transglycosylase SLT domain-containing protein [Solirubrobacterales bacterium]